MLLVQVLWEIILLIMELWIQIGFSWDLTRLGKGVLGEHGIYVWISKLGLSLIEAVRGEHGTYVWISQLGLSSIEAFRVMLIVRTMRDRKVHIMR